MIRADATFNSEQGADCTIKITGDELLIAYEYACITRGLLQADDGQAILDRAMDIMKKEINEHEEKRSK